MKRMLILALALSAAVAPSCQRSVPPVPGSGRAVVGPRGTTDVTKPWNPITKQEGDAILGPLSNARR